MLCQIECESKKKITKCIIIYIHGRIRWTYVCHVNLPKVNYNRYLCFNWKTTTTEKTKKRIFFFGLLQFWGIFVHCNIVCVCVFFFCSTVGCLHSFFHSLQCHSFTHPQCAIAIATPVRKQYGTAWNTHGALKVKRIVPTSRFVFFISVLLSLKYTLVARCPDLCTFCH